jgi:hypothetical protein
VVVSVLTPAEILIAARRFAGARPHLAAVVGIAHHEDLWQLCRDELTGVDVRIGGWGIRCRWFGVVVGATPRTGELQRGETIPWRVIAAQIDRANVVARADQMEPALIGGSTRAFSPLLSATIVSSGGSAMSSRSSAAPPRS